MKNKFIIPIIILGISLLYGAEMLFEPPLLALKLLADSTVEQCPACILKMQKQAFRMIDAVIPPEKTIETGPGIEFIRNTECEDGELMISNYSERMPASEGSDKSKLYMPLMTFYFHTGRHHLAGVNSEFLTPDSIDAIYGKPGDDAVRHFSGKIVLIPWNYGDGRSFIYFRKKNKIQVQCRILELKELK